LGSKNITYKVIVHGVVGDFFSGSAPLVIALAVDQHLANPPGAQSGQVRFCKFIANLNVTCRFYND